MLRITENSENGKTVRLRIDGTLTEICYPALESICARHQRSAGIVLLLDMAGVVFMQDEVAKLASLRGDRLRIINLFPFYRKSFCENCHEIGSQGLNQLCLLDRSGVMTTFEPITEPMSSKSK
jgi:hypothetical protein